MRSALLLSCLSACFLPVSEDPTGTGSGSGSGSGSGNTARGELLAFDSDLGTLGRDLYLINADGTGLRQFTANPGIEKEPAFSPDGTRLAYAWDDTGTFEVYVLDLATRTRTQLTRRGGEMPSWSPDGRSIVFVRAGALAVVDVQRGAEQQLPAVPNTGGGAWRFPSFSPDGKSIVADSTWVIHKLPATGGNVELLIPNTAAHEVTPVFSPDGKNIAFAEYCNEARHSIWVMPARALTQRGCNTGSGAQRLTPDDAPSSRRPAWSGDRIAYEQGAGDGNVVARRDGDLMIISQLGGTPTSLTTGPGDDRNPAWAPAGTVVP